MLLKLLFILLSIILIGSVYLSFGQTICRLPIYFGFGMIVFYFWKGWLHWLWLLPFTSVGVGLWILWYYIIEDRESKGFWGSVVCGGLGFVTGAGSVLASLWGGEGLGKAVGGVGNFFIDSAAEHYSEDSEIAWLGKLGNIIYALAIIVVLFINWK